MIPRPCCNCGRSLQPHEQFGPSLTVPLCLACLRQTEDAAAEEERLSREYHAAYAMEDTQPEEETP